VPAGGRVRPLKATLTRRELSEVTDTELDWERTLYPPKEKLFREGEVSDDVLRVHAALRKRFEKSIGFSGPRTLRAIRVKYPESGETEFRAPVYSVRGVRKLDSIRKMRSLKRPYATEDVALRRADYLGLRLQNRFNMKFKLLASLTGAGPAFLGVLRDGIRTYVVEELGKNMFILHPDYEALGRAVADVADRGLMIEGLCERTNSHLRVIRDEKGGEQHQFFALNAACKSDNSKLSAPEIAFEIGIVAYGKYRTFMSQEDLDAFRRGLREYGEEMIEHHETGEDNPLDHNLRNAIEELK